MIMDGMGQDDEKKWSMANRVPGPRSGIFVVVGAPVRLEPDLRRIGLFVNFLIWSWRTCILEATLTTIIYMSTHPSSAVAPPSKRL